MGNKPIKVGLSLDHSNVKSGGELTGRVFLSVSNNGVEFLNNITGLSLVFVGEEFSGILPEQQPNQPPRRPESIHDKVHCIVRLEIPLATFPCLPSPGHYEYPFHWTLPTNLPSSIHSQRPSSYCGIRYKLTALLNSKEASPSPDFSATQSLLIVGRAAAAARPTIPSDAVVVEPEFIPVHRCCCYKGSMMLGADVSSTIIEPNSTLTIGVTGGNASVVDVQHLQATLVETVKCYNTLFSNKNLVERKFAPNPCWVPLHPSTFQGHARYNTPAYNAEDNDCRVHGLLRVPNDALDSYKGNMIQVEHSIVVTAVTTGTIFATCPRVNIPVQVQRTMEVDDNNLLDCISLPNKLDDGSPLASVTHLPKDWAPFEADVVFIPSTVGSLDNQLYSSPGNFT